MAHCQEELRAAGWRLLTAHEGVVAMLGNKRNLHELARKLDLVAHLPEHFASAASARFPCIVKPADRDFGTDVVIAREEEEAAQLLETDDALLLQELISGPQEFATTMLVREGKVFDAIATEYVYDCNEYVWPRAQELRRRYYHPPPLRHLQALSPFLAGFSGVCNANYKLGGDGEPRILEFNVRVGSDLALDVPREWARRLFGLLDLLESGLARPLDLSRTDAWELSVSDWMPPLCEPFNWCSRSFREIPKKTISEDPLPSQTPSS